MSISDLGSLGEFIGSIAVLLTLIYLALQIRQNTHATRAVSHHAITDALNQLNLTPGKDDVAAQIWITGMNDRSSLNEVQREQFDALLRAYMHVCDTMYYQAQVGAGDWTPGFIIALDPQKAMFQPATGEVVVDLLGDESRKLGIVLGYLT